MVFLPLISGVNLTRCEAVEISPGWGQLALDPLGFDVYPEILASQDPTNMMDFKCRGLLGAGGAGCCCVFTA
jgi:hypothetical protein